MALLVDLVALSIGLHGSEHWIAWLCPNGFGGSIFMDWVALPPWNTQILMQEYETIKHEANST